MSRSRLAALSLIVAFLCPVRSEGENPPSVLTCRSNAKVSRGYAFGGRQWEGPTDQAAVPFDVQTRDSKIAGLYYSLRDKVFSGLNGSKPVVHSITRLADGTDMGEDFAARVVSRTANAIFILLVGSAKDRLYWAKTELCQPSTLIMLTLHPLRAPLGTQLMFHVGNGYLTDVAAAVEPQESVVRIVLPARGEPGVLQDLFIVLSNPSVSLGLFLLAREDVRLGRAGVWRPKASVDQRLLPVDLLIPIQGGRKGEIEVARARDAV